MCLVIVKQLEVTCLSDLTFKRRKFVSFLSYKNRYIKVFDSQNTYLIVDARFWYAVGIEYTSQLLE